MRVDFHAQADGSVTASFSCGNDYQGYPQTLHGGIIATLLDGAMTHCLFARRIIAVTAELTVRYVLPVQTCHPASIRAWIVKASPRLHILSSELVQDGEVRAKAQAKFRNMNSRTGLSGAS
jgi:acyl-coenzyme A thioesterase PaaI-like protein